MDQELHKTALVGRRLIDLYAVAVTQRRLILLIAAFVVLHMGFMFIAVISRVLPYNVARLVSLGIVLGYLIGWILSIVAAAQLARRVGGGYIMVILTAFIMLVPLLNLIWLSGVNGRATRHITGAGVRVGFLGVSSADLAGLIEGACFRCGYDLRAVTADRCPECGNFIGDVEP